MNAVITGVGTIGPWGAGLEALSGALQVGELKLSEVDRSKGFHATSSARTAGLVDPSVYREWLSGAAARRMSVNSRMTLAAARMAAKSAELEEAEVGGERTAVSMGTSFASSEFTARLLEQINENGPQAASPFLFMETVANAYAGQVAMHFDARGSNSTVTQREASGALAVARGLYQLSSGMVDRVIAGAVDEMSPLPHAILDRFRALARPDTNGRELSKVFDRDRAGFIASEGATVFMLEPEDFAKQRDAKIYGRVRCAIRAFDPTAPAHDWGTGAKELAGALVRGLKREGLAPRDFDRIVSGASGSKTGDRLEAKVLKEAWAGLELPTVLAPKSVTGEYGGGQLAAAILALSNQTFAPTPGFESVDPDLEIRPHDGSPMTTPDRVLVSSLASGGAACWFVLESCQ